MKTIITIVIFLLFASSTFADRVRVFYRPDGGISVTSGPEEEFDSHMKKLPPFNDVKFEDMPYEDMDESELPLDEDLTRDKWRGAKGQGVWVDESVVTEKEEIENIKKEIDEELEKPDPNAIKVIKLRRQMEKIIEKRK